MRALNFGLEYVNVHVQYVRVLLCVININICSQTRSVTCSRTSSWAPRRSRLWCSTGAPTRCFWRWLCVRTLARLRSQSRSTSCAASVTACSTSRHPRTACAPRTLRAFLRAPRLPRLPRRTWASSSSIAAPFASPSRLSTQCSTLVISTSTYGLYLLYYS